MRERSSAKSRKSPFEAYLHVLHALILRDMRTRFGASMWGYGVVVLWPCVHVFVLITIYTVQKLAAPLGDDRALFFATGAVPVLVFQYISREVPKRAPLVVAGDLNDWGAKLRPAMNGLGLRDFIGERALTYPSRLPLTQLDFVYARGLKPVGLQIPRGRIWWRMSDHLPLIAEFKL